MNYKLCPTCEKKSYSAVAKGQWICPYCQENLTHLSCDPAGKNLKAKLKLIKSKPNNCVELDSGGNPGATLIGKRD